MRSEKHLLCTTISWFAVTDCKGLGTLTEIEGSEPLRRRAINVPEHAKIYGLLYSVDDGSLREVIRDEGVKGSAKSQGAAQAKLRKEEVRRPVCFRCVVFNEIHPLV